MLSSSLRTAHRFANAYLLPTLLCSLTLICSRAEAQELGSKGNLVFGAERLFGLYFDKATVETGAGDVSRDGTEFGIGWQAPTSFGLTVPRLGVDYFVNEHLTLGGNLGLYSVSGDVGDHTGILFGVRAGYALRFTHGIAFWPRGGLTFVNIGGDGSAHVFAITLEGMFSFAPSENWSFLLGPVLDLGLTGELGDNRDYSEILFGIMMGVQGWFEI